MKRLLNRKKQAIKKWRSRAWTINPKKTKITIIKSESNLVISEENFELANFELEDLISDFYFLASKSTQLGDLCDQGAGALLDMEQT